MPTARRQASFYLDLATQRRNEETLAEAHALADLAGDKYAAAAVHQLIAATLPDSGYAIMIYPCLYKTHYGGEEYEKRRMPSGHALGLKQGLRSVSELAVKNQKDIETRHSRYFPNYRTMDQSQREEAVKRFSDELQRVYK
ncbi:MAG: hypothetical protein IH881_20015 [Myxococcales bacterium]|nr:hypothetical protein [Myxococcales bacterium]